MDGTAIIRSILEAAPCTPSQLWEAYQTALPEASRIGMSFDLKTLAETGIIRLEEGAWKLNETVNGSEVSATGEKVNTSLRDLERSFSEWLQFGKEWMEQGQELMHRASVVLEATEKERAHMQKDRDRLLKVRDAIHAASAHLELEDDPSPDGIKRTWAIK
jgi:hypothetical protein